MVQERAGGRWGSERGGGGGGGGGRQSLTRASCSAPYSSQGIAEEGGNVLFISCGWEPSYIDTPRMPGGLL